MAELAAAQRRAERAEAEAALARQLLAELRVALYERDGSSRRRGKARPAPAGNEARTHSSQRRAPRSRPAIRMTATTAVTVPTAAMTKNIEQAAIRWIQEQMADYGLTVDELKAAGCFDTPPPPPPPSVVCYRNTEALTWDGQGRCAPGCGGRSMRGNRWSFFRSDKRLQPQGWVPEYRIFQLNQRLAGGCGGFCESRSTLGTGDNGARPSIEPSA